MYCGAVTDGSVILYQVKGNDFNTPREIAASRHAHGCSQKALRSFCDAWFIQSAYEASVELGQKMIEVSMKDLMERIK